MKPGLHMFVNYDGEILLYQTVCHDGYALVPWRPFFHDSLPKAIRGALNGSFSLEAGTDLPIFIHTGGI